MVDKQRVLDSFLEYVQIDSETGNEGAMARRMVEELRALGGEVSTDHAGEATGSNGFNVYARFEGTLPGEVLLYGVHMDTVKPGCGIKPVVRDGVVYSEGDTILASDDKAGIAGLVEAIRAINEDGVPHRTFEVICTIGEEGGLHGAKQLDYSRIKAKYGLALDGDDDVGKIVIRAPGQIKLSAQVIGRTAHAGIAPERGVSAIQAAAAGVARMKLLRIDEETTANIGVFKAEFATNIVPDRVSIVAEVRSRSLDKLNAQAKHMVDCLKEGCDEYGATLEYSCDTNYVSFNLADDHPLVCEVVDTIRSMGIEPIITSTGGGSDANVFNLHGIDSVGLSMGMNQVHTTNESIKVEQLERTAEMIYRLMTTAR